MNARLVIGVAVVMATTAPAALAGLSISPQRVIAGDGQNIRAPAGSTSTSSPAAGSSKDAAAVEAGMRAAVGRARSEQQLMASPPLAATDNRFRWGDAGIGAAATAGAILVLIGALLLMRRARREAPFAAPLA